MTSKQRQKAKHTNNMLPTGKLQLNKQDTEGKTLFYTPESLHLVSKHNYDSNAQIYMPPILPN